MSDISELITKQRIIDPSPTPVPTPPPTDYPAPAPNLPDAPDAPPADDDPELNALLADDNEEDEVEAKVKEPDFETPEAKKLAEQFKEILGVDLKDALKQYTDTAAQLQQMQQQVQEQAAQVALSQLSTAWGVTGAELDKRVERVLKAAEKLSPEQRAKYDSPEGIQKLWARIESVKANQAPGSSGKSGTPSGVSKQTFKTSELRDMMIKNPVLYNSQQAAIERAFAEGRVVDDL